ncbi:hypothetical protein [Alteribacter aurantiacus]|uniref:hypothetical protein n=1 Tax=Alteribacter aurantiacus TaxID=254410 RepID=UPI0004270C71|nr:hypothetical protein [Alteribacter aurantiacus]
MNSKPSVTFAMLLVTLFLLIPPLIVYLNLNGNPITNYKIEQDVFLYLEGQGYEDEDVADYMRVRDGSTLADVYRTHIQVFFENEPDFGYHYVKMESTGEVYQLCKVSGQSNSAVSGGGEDPIHLDDECHNPGLDEISG